jgi:hypothetical protein
VHLIAGALDEFRRAQQALLAERIETFLWSPKRRKPAVKDGLPRSFVVLLCQTVSLFLHREA